MHHTISLIHQQPIGSSEINAVSYSHVVQVLRHLPSFWKRRMTVLVVHLEQLQEDNSCYYLTIGSTRQ